MVNHIDFDNPAVRQHLELHYTVCADAACGAVEAAQVPEWLKLIHLCGNNERRARDSLIETFLYRLSDALAPNEASQRPEKTGQLSLFG